MDLLNQHLVGSRYAGPTGTRLFSTVSYVDNAGIKAKASRFNFIAHSALRELIIPVITSVRG
ncbi:hypothetical protein GCM10007981_17230 [Thermocladium modestius]|uniref:Uncharacterized protein n=1 Tax=Thermocladium modestius TaxID=62609 RepID=A0A830H0H9_9CREN|nr:hypothetical protein GCM10007981_17230 [Thermocladium modestius]